MDYLFDAAPADDVAAWLKAKAPLKAAQFAQLLPELKALSFTVSGIEAADALQDIRDTIASFPQGARFNDVQKKVAAKLGQYIIDPQPMLFDETEEEAATRKQQLMTRAKFLLRHHATQAYSVAAFKELDSTREIFPYWKYLTVGDEHVRDSHKALEGKILPHDDPFWQTHFPPWEFGCRCQVVPITKGEYNRTKEREDKDQVPEWERSTFSDEMAARLRDERQVLAHIGGNVVKVGVAAPIEQPHDDSVYIFNPHTLAIPLKQLKSRYDEGTWAEFEIWARATDAGNGKTVWGWLSSTLPKPKVKRAPRAKKPKDTAPAAPPAPKSALPDTLDGLKEVKRLGGSTGAVLVQDANGTRYVMKRGASEGHLREEALADALYRAMGVPVPESRIYEDQGKPVKLAVFHEGSSLGDWMSKATPKEQAAMKARLQKHFGVDALLGSWDVIGLNQDNILVDKDGTPWRIDNGGSLRYRAMGTPKGADWNAWPTEIWSMRDAKKNAQTGAFFGGLDLKEVNEQLKGINTDVFDMAPAEVRTMLHERLANAKQVLAKVDRWKTAGFKDDYTDEVLKHVMGLRQAGISAALPAELRQTPGDVTVKDENGVPWDWLRTHTTPPVAANDPYFNDILSAAKNINYHLNAKSSTFNAAKLNAAMAHKPALEAIVQKGGAKAAMAQSYLDALAQIEAAQQGNATPIAAISPHNPAVASAPQVSTVKRLADYVSANGGDYHVVQSWKSQQGGSSWNALPVQYKRFLAEQLGLKPKDVYWKSGLPKNTPFTEAQRTAFIAHHAYVQETLAHTAMRYNDRTRGLVRIVRTEAPEAVAGVLPGTKGAALIRGVNESGAIFRTTHAIGRNSHLTEQAVPHERITGLYLHEKTAGSGDTGFLGDGENEFTFIPHNLPCDYHGDLNKGVKEAPTDGGEDAAAWGITLPSTHA